MYDTCCIVAAAADDDNNINIIDIIIFLLNECVCVCAHGRDNIDRIGWEYLFIICIWIDQRAIYDSSERRQRVRGAFVSPFGPLVNSPQQMNIRIEARAGMANRYASHCAIRSFVCLLALNAFRRQPNERKRKIESKREKDTDEKCWFWPDTALGVRNRLAVNETVGLCLQSRVWIHF